MYGINKEILTNSFLNKKNWNETADGHLTPKRIKPIDCTRSPSPKINNSPIPNNLEQEKTSKVHKQLFPSDAKEDVSCEKNHAICIPENLDPIETHYEVNIEDWTEIYNCVVDGNLERIKELHQKDSNLIRVADDQDRYFIHYAAKTDCEDVFLWLCKQYPESVSLQDPEDKFYPILAAAEKGWPTSIGQILHTNSAEISRVNEKNEDSITLAIYGNHVDAVETLLPFLPKGKAGELIAKNPYMCLAAALGNLEIGKVLYQFHQSFLREKVNNSDGLQPIHYAAFGNRIEFAKWLLEKDSSLRNAETSKGMLPVAYAEAEGYTDMIQLLTDVG